MRSLLPALFIAFAASPLFSASEIIWHTDLLLYGDNTEFFSPYRVGETILGSQFQTFVTVPTGPHTSIRAGVFGDHRSGARSFLDAKPILAFRYGSAMRSVIVGTLETDNRHGYIEPMQVATREFTRPLEYGIQFLQHSSRGRSELFLNWQHLNTPSSREIFDYGLVTRYAIAGGWGAAAQMHGVHHGGQLYDVGPVTNNVTAALGVRFDHDTSIGQAHLRLFAVGSGGQIDMLERRTVRPGRGTYLRASLEPARRLELFAIAWTAHDFVSAEGDGNFNSVGVDPRHPGYYKSARRYEELGAAAMIPLDPAIKAKVELRLHRIDQKVQYSYGFSIRIPYEIKLRNRAVQCE